MDGKIVFLSTRTQGNGGIWGCSAKRGHCSAYPQRAERAGVPLGYKENNRQNDGWWHPKGKLRHNCYRSLKAAASGALLCSCLNSKYNRQVCVATVVLKLCPARLCSELTVVQLQHGEFVPVPSRASVQRLRGWSPPWPSRCWGLDQLGQEAALSSWWDLQCAELLMVSGTQQRQTAGPALSAPGFINGVKISRNGDDLNTVLDWILLRDPVQNIYDPAIFLQLKSRTGTQV